MKIIYLTLALIIAAFSAANAAIVEFKFTIAVVEVDGAARGILHIGDTLDGSFRYDTNQVDLDSSLTFGEYFLSPASYQANLDLGPVEFTTNASGPLFVSTDSNFSLDIFTINGRFSSGGSLFLSFGQVIGAQGVPPNYFPNDQLPTALSLADLPSTSVELSSGGYYVRGTVASLSAVPEPSSSFLCLAGALSFGFRRRRLGTRGRVDNSPALGGEVVEGFAEDGEVREHGTSKVEEQLRGRQRQRWKVRTLRNRSARIMERECRK